MGPTARTWAIGLLGSAVAGALIGIFLHQSEVLLVPGLLFGLSTFTCVRLWLGRDNRTAVTTAIWVFGLLAGALAGCTIGFMPVTEGIGPGWFIFPLVGSFSGACAFICLRLWWMQDGGMAQTAAIWMFGLPPSMFAGAIVVGYFNIQSLLTVVFAGPLAFSCLRLWLGQKAGIARIIDAWAFGLLSTSFAGGIIGALMHPSYDGALYLFAGPAGFILFRLWQGSQIKQ